MHPKVILLLGLVLAVTATTVTADSGTYDAGPCCDCTCDCSACPATSTPCIPPTTTPCIPSTTTSTPDATTSTPEPTTTSTPDATTTFTPEPTTTSTPEPTTTSTLEPTTTSTPEPTTTSTPEPTTTSTPEPTTTSTPEPTTTSTPEPTTTSTPEPTTTSTPEPTTITTTPTPTPTVCVTQPLDIVFVLDMSASVGDKNWPILVNFVADLIAGFPIGKAESHVGVVRFAGEPDTHTDYDLTTLDKAVIEAGVRALPFEWTEKGTHTNLGLTAAQNILQQGARSGVPTKIIVVTDGKTTRRKQTLAAMQSIRDAGYEVIAVGIGKVSLSDLEELATNGVVYKADNFAELEALKGQLTGSVCA